MRRSLGNPVPVVFVFLSMLMVGALAVAPVAEGQPATTGECTLRTLSDQGICVCLESPASDPHDRLLLLDGQPVGGPTAGTSRALFYRLPADTPPGEHAVALSGSAADSVTDRPRAPCTVEVIRILAQLDQERIWQGQGTPLRIRVEGTREPVRLRLVNESPEIVTLEGGAVQEATTSGGGTNTLERRVRGVARGDFDIQYEFLDGGCPCSEYPGDGVFTDSGTTPDPPSRPPTEGPSTPGSPGEGTSADGEPPGGRQPPPETPPGTSPPSGDPPTTRSPTSPPTVSRPTVSRPTVSRPTVTVPVTTPGPEEPPRQPCASIGEEIETIEGRYTTLSEEMSFETVPGTEPLPTTPPPVTRPTVVQTGPTGHPYCDRTYTTWARGAQAVSIHRLMTQVKDLADFCLGQGTCTPEGHQGYMEDLSRLASTLRGDERFLAVAGHMPELAESLLREYRHELERVRRELDELRGLPAQDDPAHRYRLRQAAREVRSWERSLEGMERWRKWSRDLVVALETGELLRQGPPITRPTASREENSP